MHYAMPIIAAAALWWISTGAILALTRLKRAQWRYVAAGAGAIGFGATVGVVLLRTVDTVPGAYLGFVAGLAMWAFHEVMFLFGFITGPRKTPCPSDLTLGARFRAATETVIHHEIGIALHGVVILALGWGAANQVAGQTFLLLWVMRLSVKFVLFFGAPRLPSHVMPAHLEYLASYFHQRTDSSFLPVATLGAFALAVGLGVMAAQHAVGAFAFIGYVLLTTLAALAVLEHAALRLNLPDRLLGVSPARKGTPVSTTTHEPSRI